MMQRIRASLFVLVLVTNFTDQWATICLEASMKLENLVKDFRQKTEVDIRTK